MKSLDSYFRQAADRPLAFSDENLRGMLEAYDATPFRYDDITRRRFGWVTGRLITLGAALTLATILVLWLSGRDPAAESPGTDTPRPAAAHAVPPSNARTSSPAAPTPYSTERATALESAPSAASAASSHLVQPIALAAAPPSLTVAAPTMIDLAASESDGLGLRRLAGGRTAFAYYLIGADLRNSGVDLDQQRLLQGGYSDSLLVRTIGPDGLKDLLVSRAAFPLSVVTRRASPIAAAWQIVTDDQGRLLDNRIRPADAAQLRAITALFARGAADRGARTADSLLGLDALSRELRLNTLVPIRVATGATDNPRAIFWCMPVPELLAQLPEHAITLLRNELEAAAAATGPLDTIAIVRRGWALSVLESLDSLRPERLAVDNSLEIASSDRLTGGGVFGGSRRKAGAVTRFLPNLSAPQRRIDFALGLREPRSLTVTLHKVTGERVSTLLRTDLLQEGDVALSASVAGIPNGLYLIALVTDRGEEIVQRVVVE